MKAQGLGYSQDRVRVQNATLSCALHLNPDRLTLRDLRATALGATVTGQADLKHGRISISTATLRSRMRAKPWPR